MEALIVPIALIILAIAAVRFGHDSRPGLHSFRDLRRDAGFREETEIEPATPTPVRPSRPQRLADARH
ncbi:MAG TPA: hypothetical protein VD767_09230 [Thermomicrobiales bacterium]|nr:hypothetical protein [Thermomicrobiales bacterium]